MKKLRYLARIIAGTIVGIAGMAAIVLLNVVTALLP
jgi:hypothetical protein